MERSEDGSSLIAHAGLARWRATLLPFVLVAHRHGIPSTRMPGAAARQPPKS